MRDFPEKTNAIILFAIAASISFGITDVQAQHEYMTIYDKRQFFTITNSIIYTIFLFVAWFMRPSHSMTEEEIRILNSELNIYAIKKIIKFFLVSILLSGFFAGLISAMR